MNQLIDNIFFIILIFLVGYVFILRNQNKEYQVVINNIVLRSIENFLEKNKMFKQVGHYHSDKQKFKQVILFEDEDGNKFLMQVGSIESYGYRKHLENEFDSGKCKLIKRVNIAPESIKFIKGDLISNFEK